MTGGAHDSSMGFPLENLDQLLLRQSMLSPLRTGCIWVNIDCSIDEHKEVLLVSSSEIIYGYLRTIYNGSLSDLSSVYISFNFEFSALLSRAFVCEIRYIVQLTS